MKSINKDMELVIVLMYESLINDLEKINYPKGLSKIARDMFAENTLENYL